MKWSNFFLSLLIIAAATAACKGGEKCGPGSSPLSDADSDCISDESDNCPLEYNPAQADGDEDGVGFSCDSDDANDAVAVSLNDGQALMAVFYVFPDETIMTQPSSSCPLSIINCNHEFLGQISQEGLSLAGDAESFFADSSPCSAFNPNATLPPALFCGSDFAGYLTVNPDIPDTINPCEALENLATIAPDPSFCQ